MIHLTMQDKNKINISAETDPTVPNWAKQPQKPTYTPEEVGALPSDTKIPSKVSDLDNDSGYLTEHQDISGKENISNKTNSVSAFPSNANKYPSTKGVFDFVNDRVCKIKVRTDIGGSYPDNITDKGIYTVTLYSYHDGDDDNENREIIFVTKKYDDDGDTICQTRLKYDGSIAYRTGVEDMTPDELPYPIAWSNWETYVVKSDLKTKSDKTDIETNTQTAPSEFTLAHNTEYRFTNALTNLDIDLPQNPNDDFISSIVFISGSTATSYIYPDGISWTGDDLTGGQFVPKANRRYTLVIWYDGVWNGAVRGTEL